MKKPAAVESAMKKPAAVGYIASAPTFETASFPCVYLGCKIYESEAQQAWRVYQSAGSVYGKPFSVHSFKVADKTSVWKDVLAHCKKHVHPLG